jgi:hypothetical protein
MPDPLASHYAASNCLHAASSGFKFAFDFASI